MYMLRYLKIERKILNSVFGVMIKHIKIENLS
jgi:hypothetical protein